MSDIKLYQGDCLEVMKGIEDNSIDMILCDLPYGTTACKWDSVIPMNSHVNGMNKVDFIINGISSGNTYPEMLIMWENMHTKGLWEHYNRIIKRNGAIVLTCAQPFTTKLVDSNIRNYRESIVWEKHKPSNFACGKYMHLKYHEDIIVFCNGKPTYNPQMQKRESDRVKQMQKGKSKKWNTIRTDGNEVSCQTQYGPKEWTDYDAELKYPSTIIKIPSVNSNGKEKCNHPTQKPVELMERLIQTYTNENEVVLDNCMGSGSTGVACVNTNRRFIGIELDENYFNIAKERIEKAKEGK